MLTKEGIELIQVIYVLNAVVLVSLALDFQANKAERLFMFGIVRILIVLLILIATYLHTYFTKDHNLHPFFFNSENVFSLIWLVLAYRIHIVTPSSGTKKTPYWLLVLVGASAVIIVATYVYFHPLSGGWDEDLVFSHYGIIYCSALFLIMAVLFFGWRLEAFWRSLDAGDKWRYKYIVIGFFLVCAMLGWSSSYRLAFLRLPSEHLLLLAIILVIALFLIVYALAKHRLLNRKIFVSRKVVYATITPIVFSVFFISVGIISLISRLYGWSVPFILQWLIIIVGVLGITILALSGGIRRRVKFYISTHFYVNKYEYRDEWLAFSDLLQGKLTEKGIVEAMYQILKDSLYTQTILIWLGDIQKGFRLVNMGGEYDNTIDEIIAGDDAIVCYLHNAPYFYSQDRDADPLRRSILIEKEALLQTHGIVLMVPLILGNHCAGLIGLGPETTGDRYGHDDFDLLLAMGSHAASALVAVQNAEKLALSRERTAYSNVSAFILHDIKNAATMLDLVRSNAPENINNPEFQKDMLDSIDDALKRMSKVQTRLSSLKDELILDIRPVVMGDLLRSSVDRFATKLPGLEIELCCPPDILLQTDPDFISQIIENLLINALESGGGGTAVRIQVAVDSMLQIDVKDNGPGIPTDLLPMALFEPFKTSKPNGSGIGLWQVQQLLINLGGDIQAQNIADEGGARFTLRFPYRDQKPY